MGSNPAEKSGDIGSSRITVLITHLKIDAPMSKNEFHYLWRPWRWNVCENSRRGDIYIFKKLYTLQCRLYAQTPFFCSRRCFFKQECLEKHRLENHDDVKHRHTAKNHNKKKSVIVLGFHDVVCQLFDNPPLKFSDIFEISKISAYQID